MKNYKAVSIILAAVLIVSMFALAACGNKEAPAPAPAPAPAASAPAAAAPAPAPVDDTVYTLSLVSFRPENHNSIQALMRETMNKLPENSNGRLVVEWIGGPEVANASDVGMLVQNGSFDIADIYVGAYESVVPGISGASLTQWLPNEERANGVYEYLDGLHQAAGLKYLGRSSPQTDNFFYLWFKNKKPMSIEDFKTVSIGTAAGSKDAVEAWGVTPTNVMVPENYEALNSGIVDAIAGQPLSGALANGWESLVSYVVDHPYYQSTTMMIMNLDKWNSLPADLQEIFTQTVADGELAIVKFHDENEVNFRKQIEDAGAEFYKLPPDVADWFLTQAYDAVWAAYEKNNPTVIPEMRARVNK